MAKHIMHSDVVSGMNKSNSKRIEALVKKIGDAIEPIREEMESAEKWDECLIIDMYIRKWNDMLTMSQYHVNFWTSCTTQDKYMHLQFYRDHMAISSIPSDN